MRARFAAAVVAAVVTAAPSAPRADDFWRGVATSGEQEVAERAYDKAMLEGDEALDLAVAETAVRSRRRKYVDRAVIAYESAARAMPSMAEPHFRAARTLYAFLLDCSPRDDLPLCDDDDPIDPVLAQRVIDHWDAFERLAPLDPRVPDEILFERAILHTKLVATAHLTAARNDYLEIIARRALTKFDGVVLGNLAETEMMLGDLDGAIEMYHRTLELDQSSEHYFGLAVALDRDEQGEEARAILRSLGADAVRGLAERIQEHLVFYVPDGEAYYYLALGAEANGMESDAIALYDRFIASGAHPQYAPRARANRDALLAHHRRNRPAPHVVDW